MHPFHNQQVFSDRSEKYLASNAERDVKEFTEINGLQVSSSTFVHPLLTCLEAGLPSFLIDMLTHLYPFHEQTWVTAISSMAEILKKGLQEAACSLTCCESRCGARAHTHTHPF